MTTGKMGTEPDADRQGKQIEAINSLTVALRLSGINREGGGNRMSSAVGRLSTGDPAPLMLWGEEQ